MAEGEGAGGTLPTSGVGIVGSVGDAGKGMYEAVRHPLSEEGVFNRVVQIATGKNTYETEKAEPIFKLLKAKAIDGTAAMAGMKDGQSQVTITGDHSCHITGGRTTFVDGKEFLQILLSQQEKTFGDALFEYEKHRQVGVQGDDDYYVGGDQDTYILGKSTENFVGKHTVNAPEEYEWKQFERGFSALKLDMALLELDLHISNIDIHIKDVDLHMFESTDKTFSDVKHAIMNETRALVLAAAIQVQVWGRLNAAPDFGLTQHL